MSLKESQREWQAVFQPGLHATMAVADEVEVKVTRPVSLTSAWWLAQCCHVSYIEESCKRQEMFARAKLVETASFSKWALHWSRIERSQPDGLAIIAFRGSSDPRHWMFNTDSWLSDHAFGGKAHRGFQRAFAKIEALLRDELESRPPRAICFTGHSLGGALALLAATQWRGGRCYTFGSPRVGNAAFAQQVAASLAVTRVVHGNDLVSALPEGIEFTESHAYRHAGDLVQISDEGVARSGDAAEPNSVTRLMKDSIRELVDGKVKLGEPLPALLDHAPEGYVRALKKCVGAQGSG